MAGDVTLVEDMVNVRNLIAGEREGFDRTDTLLTAVAGVAGLCAPGPGRSPVCKAFRKNSILFHYLRSPKHQPSSGHGIHPHVERHIGIPSSPPSHPCSHHPHVRSRPRPNPLPSSAKLSKHRGISFPLAISSTVQGDFYASTNVPHRISLDTSKHEWYPPSRVQARSPRL
ncbi:hypothetical protein P691DRAFT_764599 [Macrolepiota fuliginosa MF-IS2]|uniref:Uncharacterized protein n=1 Tax=Macrolepiota fuliginosa MF-IS2 TaxID=1400762 RepID=A0A9P5X2G7_9AGAR|nr:hypothetical protein P691DRAFT_764599 [Macrolepiota fuliginosa MF-IS2]